VSQRVAPAGAVGPGKIEAFMVDGKRVAVVNTGGNLYAFDDKCTHMGCSLADGDLDGFVIECACHGSQYDVRTGEVIRGPARQAVQAHAVAIEGDQLAIE
jgi:nitrite reductase/ring-hydroxylating ferredoxin subunit